MPSPHSIPTEYSNTFLLSRGDGKAPVLKELRPEEATTRRKKHHTKSRLGCTNCKRRKVKCDEQDPCGNCIKRREACSHERPVSLTTSPEPTLVQTTPILTPLSPLQTSYGVGVGVGVNALHLELLYHFSTVTVPTLSFPEIWPEMVQTAFQKEYLLNAILAVAATHMATLLPGATRYSRTACSLLARSLEDFRVNLSTPITPDNCGALLGTAILVHFLAWCDLDFLGGRAQGPDAPLDISQDRLFLLGAGMRQIFFMAWPVFKTHQRAFMSAAVYKPTVHLEEVIEMRAIDWRSFRDAFMTLYDDPRYFGGRTTASSPVDTATSPSTPQPPFEDGGSADPTPHCTLNLSDTIALYKSTQVDFLLSLDPQQAMQVATLLSEPPLTAGHEALARASYERVVSRLSVLISFIADAPCPSNAGKSAQQHFPMPNRTDLSRFVCSFPTLVFGPFLPLVLGGDSRALVVLFHLYRAARMLLPTDEAWWCGRRAAVMEGLIRRELSERGLAVCLRKEHGW